MDALRYRGPAGSGATALDQSRPSKSEGQTSSEPDEEIAGRYAQGLPRARTSYLRRFGIGREPVLGGSLRIMSNRIWLTSLSRRVLSLSTFYSL
jgi:hypothetical protein